MTESLVSEWMHDWGNPKAMELVRDVYSQYGYMIGLQEGRQGVSREKGVIPLRRG